MESRNSTNASGTGLIWWGIGLNLVLVGLKSIGGYFGNSEALFADAVESAGDVFASIILLIGLFYSNRPPDLNHPYGHGRAQPLLIFAMVVILVVSVFVIAYRSTQNIFTPHELPERFTLWILGATIISKEALYRFASHRAKKSGDGILKADAMHHRSDAITSVAALAGISIAIWLGKGYESADDYAALLACAVILYNAYRLFRPALSEIMDEHTYDELIAEIRKASAGVPGVINTEKCFVRKSGSAYYVDLHVTVDGKIPVVEGHTIAHNVQSEIQKQVEGVAQVLIHIEPEPDSVPQK